MAAKRASTHARKIDASLILMGASFARGALALVPMIALASTFGLGSVTDAYLVALQVTRSFSKVLRLGTLQKIYTTIFSRRTVEGSLLPLQRPISNLINVSIAVLLPVTAVLIALAPRFVPLVAPGFPRLTTDLAVAILQLLCLLTLSDALASLFVGALHAGERFTLAAIAGVLPAAIVAVAALVGLPSFGIFALVWGNILGSALYLALLYLGMIRAGFRHRRVFKPGDPDLRNTVKLVGPFYLGALVMEGCKLVTVVVLGSMLPPGGFSALVYATRVAEYVKTNIFGSVLTVAYPSMVQRTGESIERMREHMARVLRMVNYVTLPLLFWLVVFSREVVQLLFHRGAFSERDVESTAIVLVILIVGLIPKGLEAVLGNALYALQRTGWINTFYVAAQLAVTAMSVALFPWYGLNGIALATTSVTSLLVIQQGVYLSRRFSIGDILADRESLKILAVALVGGATAYGLRQVLTETSLSGWWVPVSHLLLATLPAGIVYVALSRCLKIGELTMITSYLFGRLYAERWMPAVLRFRA